MRREAVAERVLGMFVGRVRAASVMGDLAEAGGERGGVDGVYGVERDGGISSLVFYDGPVGGSFGVVFEDAVLN